VCELDDLASDLVAGSPRENGQVFRKKDHCTG